MAPLFVGAFFEGGLAIPVTDVSAAVLASVVGDAERGVLPFEPVVVAVFTTISKDSELLCDPLAAVTSMLPWMICGVADAGISPSIVSELSSK